MSQLDFLMIYPHPDIMAYSQRLLLGVLAEAGYKGHLLVVPSLEPIQTNAQVRGQILDLVRKSRMVGFGFMSNAYKVARGLTDIIKAEFPDKTVIWGGPHANDTRETLRGEADAVFIGDSEVVLRQFVDAHLAGRPTDSIPQIIAGERPYIPARAEDFLEDLDLLPDPLYDCARQSIVLPDRLETDPAWFRGRLTGLQMLTSRGCPYACTYCNNSFMQELIPGGVKQFRKRSVGHIMREVRTCRENFDITGVVIEDDLFLARKPEELEHFAERYNAEVRLPLGITGVTPSLLNPRNTAIIAKLPLQHLRVGIESMSEKGIEIFDRVGPNKNMERAMTSIATLPKSVVVSYDIILDSPYETEADYVATLRFAAAMPKPFRLNLYHLTFFSGTTLRDKAVADGIITPDDETFLTRRYGKLDATYINSLYLLLDAVGGFLPQWLVRALTSRWVLDRPGLKDRLKDPIAAMARRVKPLNVTLWCRRLSLLAQGRVGWRRVLRRIGVPVGQPA